MRKGQAAGAQASEARLGPIAQATSKRASSDDLLLLPSAEGSISVVADKAEGLIAAVWQSGSRSSNVSDDEPKQVSLWKHCRLG